MYVFYQDNSVIIFKAEKVNLKKLISLKNVPGCSDQADTSGHFKPQ